MTRRQMMPQRSKMMGQTQGFAILINMYLAFLFKEECFHLQLWEEAVLQVEQQSKYFNVDVRVCCIVF